MKNLILGSLTGSVIVLLLTLGLLELVVQLFIQWSASHATA